MNYILKGATSTFQHVIDTSHKVKSKWRQKNQTQSLKPFIILMRSPWINAFSNKFLPKQKTNSKIKQDRWHWNIHTPSVSLPFSNNVTLTFHEFFNGKPTSIKLPPYNAWQLQNGQINTWTSVAWEVPASWSLEIAIWATVRRKQNWPIQFS